MSKKGTLKMRKDIEEMNFTISFDKRLAESRQNPERSL
jgi:hypothetical protein